jgi:hypothetical protein
MLPRFPLVKKSEGRRNFAFMKIRVLKNDDNSKPCWCSANLEFRFAPKIGFFLKLTLLEAPQAKKNTLVVGMFGLVNLSCFSLKNNAFLHDFHRLLHIHYGPLPFHIGSLEALKVCCFYTRTSTIST